MGASAARERAVQRGVWVGPYAEATSHGVAVSLKPMLGEHLGSRTYALSTRALRYRAATAARCENRAESSRLIH